MFKRKKNSVLLVVILVMSLLLTACGGENTDVNSVNQSTNGDTTPETEVKKELVVATNMIGNTLDDIVANAITINMIVRNTSNSLVKFDEDLNIVPDIATSWERVDELTWEFTIGKGYKFQNGDDLKLSDIVFSFTRLKDIPQGLETVKNIEKFEAVGDDIIRITTSISDNVTINKLSNIFIVSERYATEAGEDFGQTIVGTGPYRVTEFVNGSHVVLETWDDYPFEQPKIKKITFKNIDDNSSRYIAVETGEADISTNIKSEDVERAKSNDKLNIIEYDMMGVSFLAFNTVKEPYNNPLVRRAIAHATNRDGLIALKGSGTLANSMVPKAIIGASNKYKYPEYDLEKAKDLFKEAGYEEGLQLEIWAYGETTDSEILQADLRTIGVELEIKNLEFGVFLDGVMKQEYPMCFGKWSNTNACLIDGLDVYRSDAMGLNISFYNNPIADKLCKNILTSTENNIVLESADALQKIGAEDVPMVPISYPEEYTVENIKVSGVKYISTGVYEFSNADIKE